MLRASLVLAAVAVAAVPALVVWESPVTTLQPVPIANAPGPSAPSDCLVLDALGDLRNGWLTQVDISTYVCCTDRGEYTSANGGLCVNGCDGAKVTLDSFYYQGSVCLQKCYDVVVPDWVPSGATELSVRLGINSISGPAPLTSVLTLDTCPISQVRSRTFVAYRGLASNPSETPLAGWAVELSAIACDTNSYYAVCTSKGVVAADGTCAQGCAAFLSDYAAIVSDPSVPTPQGTACYWNCYVPATACVGLQSVYTNQFVPVFTYDYATESECTTAYTCGTLSAAATAVSFGNSGMLPCATS